MIRSCLTACVTMNIAATSADTITVCAEGCDHTSINEAIAAANDGDIIRLAAETYQEGEQIDTRGKSITIEGSGMENEGPTTVLDGADLHRVLGIPGGTVVLRHLRVQNGHSVAAGDGEGGGGIRAANASLTVDHCVITTNWAGEGGGLRLENCVTEILASEVTHNQAYGDYSAGISGNGGGLCILGGATSVVASTIAYNHSEWGDGGGCICTGELDLVDTEFINNGAIAKYFLLTGNLNAGTASVTDCVLRGGSVSLGDAEIRGTVFEGGEVSIGNGRVVESTFNSIDGPLYGGGCSCCTTGGSAISLGSTEFDSCQFLNLVASDAPTAVGGSLFTNCVFEGNESRSTGGYSAGGAVGGALKPSLGARIEGCQFRQNSAGSAGAVAATNATILNSIFESNQALGAGMACDKTEYFPGSGGGVMLTGGIVDGCTFEWNVAADTGQALHADGTEVSNSSFCGGTDLLTTGAWFDLGGNVFGQSCPATGFCTGDYDGDGLVVANDLGVWLTFAGTKCAPGNPCPGDLDGDGEVRGSDLGLLLLNWGICD